MRSNQSFSVWRDTAGDLEFVSVVTLYARVEGVGGR